MENFALEEGPLIRSCINRAKEKDAEIDVGEAEKMIDSILDTMKADCSSQIIANWIRFSRNHEKHKNDATIIKLAQEAFDRKWETRSGRLSVVSGKEFISLLSGEMQRRFKVNLSIYKLIDEQKKAEVGSDLIELLRAVDQHFGVSSLSTT